MRNSKWMLVTAITLWAVNASAAEQATVVQEHRADIATAKTSLTRESLLGVDTDGDGIRDDIEAIVAKSEPVQSGEDKSETPTEEALAVLRERKVASKQPQRRTCMEYLLLGPSDRSKTDLRMQQRTNGVVGTHPCDPVVSPLLERPFETDFAHLDLGPVSLRY